MCPSHGCRVTCHAHVLPASQALQPPLGARTLQRRSTVTVCSHSLSWRVQGCILHSFGNCMPSDGDLHTARMLHSCCDLTLNSPTSCKCQHDPAWRVWCSSCWSGQWCPKQLTADTGEETLSLKNPKFWLFHWDKNNYRAICCSGEQLFCSHSPCEEEKGCYSEKKTTVFSVSSSPQAHTDTAAGLWLLSIHSHALGTSWGSGQWVKLHSCCCLFVA